MGRRKMELTEAQLEARKRKYWGEERNQQRRERYRSDPAYRQQVMEQVRESYRRKREEAGLPVRTGDCRENLELLPEIATRREVHFPDGEIQERVSLTVDELAEALQRNTQVVYRWINAGLFPKPALTTPTHRNRKQAVYLVEEAEAFLTIFGEHQESSQYYRSYHTDTQRKLHGAAQEVRQSLGVEDDSTCETA